MAPSVLKARSEQRYILFVTSFPLAITFWAIQAFLSSRGLCIHTILNTSGMNSSYQKNIGVVGFMEIKEPIEKEIQENKYLGAAILNFMQISQLQSLKGKPNFILNFSELNKIQMGAENVYLQKRGLSMKHHHSCPAAILNLCIQSVRRSPPLTSEMDFLCQITLDKLVLPKKKSQQKRRYKKISIFGRPF